MRTYKAIIFDLFDTIVNFNRSLLPEAELNGSRINSTSVAVYMVFKNYYEHVTFDDFYSAFLKSYDEFEEMKRKQNLEFHNKERFKLMLDKLNISTNSDSNRFVEEMVLCHMGKIADAMEFPEENRNTLNMLRYKYRLALISNFDHAPTAYKILDKFGIRNFFEKILISIEVGIRKPKADIFLKAFIHLKINPNDAIFVGDNFEADVIGSKNVGMDVIWVNKGNEKIRHEITNPDYEVTKFAEITKIL